MVIAKARGDQRVALCKYTFVNNISSNLLYCKLAYDWHCVSLWVMTSRDPRAFAAGFNSCVESAKALLLVKSSAAGAEVDM